MIPLPCHTMSGGEDVAIGYETAATELLSGLEENCDPRELMRAGVDAAHDPLLIRRDRILVAALQRQSLGAGATWRPSSGGRGCGCGSSGVTRIGGSPSGCGSRGWRSRCGALCAWHYSGGGGMRGIMVVGGMGGQWWWPATRCGRVCGQRRRPLGHASRKGAKWPLVRIYGCTRLGSHWWLNLLLSLILFLIRFLSWFFRLIVRLSQRVYILEVRGIFDTVRVVDWVLWLGILLVRWLLLRPVHTHSPLIFGNRWLLRGRGCCWTCSRQWEHSKGIWIYVGATNTVVDPTQLVEKVAQIPIQTQSRVLGPLAQGDEGQLTGHPIILAAGVDADTHSGLTPGREASGSLPATC